MSIRPLSSRTQALILFVVLWLAYNANGREVGSADTQPAKYLAAGVVLRHTLTLNAVVTEKPGLAERPGFMRDRQGDWRSAYPILPALIAAVPAALLHTLGAVDMAAPLAPNLIAVLTASTLTACAVVLVFLSLTRLVSTRQAWWTSVGLGLGTSFWPTVSQTLGQQDVVACGFALALWALWRVEDVTGRRLLVGALGLALAGAARPQVAPVVLVMGLALFIHAGWRRAIAPAAVVVSIAAVTMAANLWWFGHILGGSVQIEAVHASVHHVPGVVSDHPLRNAAALLISPSRGLLIFSPIVVLALAGLLRRRIPADLRWLAVAIAVQFSVYASYSVWWGGHAFGPRYMSDLLILLAPFGALGLSRVARFPVLVAGVWLLLGWSIGVSALGAFVYPNERWNTDPLEVDRHHERLADWSDSQIIRAWRAAPSPQNLDLWSRAAVRR